MNIQFNDTPVQLYAHPELKAGKVYRMIGTHHIYLGVMIPVRDCTNKGHPKPHLYLVNVTTGERYSDVGCSGGNARFEDITAECFLMVKTKG